MLAAAVGVDGAVEGQVGGGVAGDDGLGQLDPHLGSLGERDFLVPAVVLGHRMVGGEAVVGVGGGAAATEGGWLHDEKPGLLYAHTVIRVFLEHQCRQADCKGLLRSPSLASQLPQSIAASCGSWLASDGSRSDPDLTRAS